MTPKKSFMRAKSPVQLGDWFAVPLRTGGYGVGVVARKQRKGIVFGYFFGPRRSSVPRLSDVERLRASDAVLVRQFGDLGLLEGKWPIIGKSNGWRMEDWPLPAFGRIDTIAGGAWCVRYPDDLSGIGQETRCSVEEAKALPEDGLSGYGALEVRLTKAIERNEQSKQGT